MSETIQAIRGMNDVLPADAPVWERFDDTVRAWLRRYGYRQIRMPVLEKTDLFVRSIGEVTDIVEKEMYTFTDRLNGDSLTLRPEGTASCVRAVLEHNLLYGGSQRLWYAGPMFRHERPQKGRYRQFHQVGAEALGLAGPDADAEVILLCQRLWDDLGLDGVRLEINSLGAVHERRAHREALIGYFEAHRDALDAEAQRRLHSNPLRILDTKNPAMQALVEQAPRLIDHLGPESLAHFERLQALLRSQNLPYRINPRLVRGLDYYNLTVFEWVADVGGSALTVCGGGRYDPLIEMLGGKPAPACGFAVGVERVIELMRARGDRAALPQCEVYVVHHGDETLEAALQAAERLRDAGLDVILHCGGGGFKAQFKRADASGAQIAVIVGVDELARGEVSVKWLRAGEPGEAGRQQAVSLDRLTELVIDAIVANQQLPDDTEQ